MQQLSVREAADLLGVHPARVVHWIASGRLTALWQDGPAGRYHSVDAASVALLRRDLGIESESKLSEVAGAVPENPTNDPPDALARARAVESYTAGLAATAIAPAVSRLVETIEQLIRENGDLREEVGRLKARTERSADHELDAVSAVEAAPSESPAAGLADQEWEALRERLDRLSEPLSEKDAPEAKEIPPTAVLEVEHGLKQSTAEPRTLSRKRRVSPLRRLVRWFQAGE